MQKTFQLYKKAKKENKKILLIKKFSNLIKKIYKKIER